MDCFNCIYDDCICDMIPTEEEINISEKIDKEINQIGIVSMDKYTKKRKISLEKYSVKDYNREYYKLYGDIIKENAKAKYDKEKNAARCKKYREKNVEKIKDSKKKYYQKNKERLKKYAKERYYKLKEA